MWWCLGARGTGAATAWLALAGACASVPPQEEGARRDAAPQADAGRPMGGRDAGRPDAGRPDAGDIDADPPDGGPGGPGPHINEFVADHAGTDLCEFVEIVGEPATDYSDHAILVVEGDSGTPNAGSIDAVIPVGTTDDIGLWASEKLNGQLENGSTTLLLVSGLTVGPIDLDSDDDGTIDQQPWTRLADAVAVSDGSPSDRHYAGGALLEPLYDGVAFAVGGASRIPDGTDTDAPADWVRNDFDGAGLGCGIGSPVPGEALNTRGASNLEAIAP